jgi:hypothetical protein
MKLPVSPNDGSTNASRGSDTHSGPNIPDFPTEFVTQNTAQAKTKRTNANQSSKAKYKSDSEASDSDDDKKQPRRKKSKGGKSAANTTGRSDVGVGARATREVAGPSGASGPTRLVDLGSFGLKWYSGIDDASRTLLSAYSVFVGDSNSKYLRVTLLPFYPSPKSGVTSFILFIPILLSNFREYLRKQARSSAKFPGPELTDFTMGQPLLRHGVHVHAGGGGCGSSVSLYANKQFITFSNDGLQSVESKGVDWSVTNGPLTFQVKCVDKHLHANTECLNLETRISRKLPTVLDDGFYAYLSEHVTCTPTQLSNDDQNILDGHLSMEKR